MITINDRIWLVFINQIILPRQAKRKFIYIDQHSISPKWAHHVAYHENFVRPWHSMSSYMTQPIRLDDHDIYTMSTHQHTMSTANYLDGDCDAPCQKMTWRVNRELNFDCLRVFTTYSHSIPDILPDNSPLWLELTSRW